LNPKKSKVMLIHRLANDLPQPRLVIGSDVVKIVSTVVDLGFILNSRLTPVDHFSKAASFDKASRFLYTYPGPHINYSNIVYSHIDSASLRKLLVAYNACLPPTVEIYV
jgi:hypothetical protein